MTDSPPLVPGQNLTAQIAAELIVAWTKLGGRPDNLPIVADASPALYDAFQRQGADSNLLAIIGSWGDTADDDDILHWLRLYNAGEPVIHPPQ